MVSAQWMGLFYSVVTIYLYQMNFERKADALPFEEVTTSMSTPSNLTLSCMSHPWSASVHWRINRSTSDLSKCRIWLYLPDILLSSNWLVMTSRPQHVAVQRSQRQVLWIGFLYIDRPACFMLCSCISFPANGITKVSTFNMCPVSSKVEYSATTRWGMRYCLVRKLAFLKLEFCLCARRRQWCGIIHYHWWTASIKPRLLFSRAGYASWGLSLSSV